MAATGNDGFKLENLFNVKDKVAVVTGGGSGRLKAVLEAGIGLMCTQALAVNGAKVYIIGRTREKLETVANHYGKDIPGQIIPLQGDISSKQGIQKIYEEIKEKEKCVCILINNAGVASATLNTEVKEGAAEQLSQDLFHNKDSTIEDWMSTYQTNVPSCFFMTTAFLPLLQKSTELHKGYSGCVINISSISGIIKSAQHHFAYNASKAAVIHLTKMLAHEIGKNSIKIRVNSIAPGVFPSEMTAETSGEDQKSEIEKEKFEGKVYAQRPGNDQDFGNGILFVATNQYLNGQIIAIDGGYILQHGSA